MTLLTFSGLLLASRMLLISEQRLNMQPLCDPFRRAPVQESGSGLGTHRPTPRTTQQLRQWRLQGLVGTPPHKLWGLVRTPTGEWHCLRRGMMVMGYRVIAIDQQRVLLKRQQPATAPIAPPLILPWVGNGSALLAVERR